MRLEGSAADEVGLPLGGIAGHGDGAGSDGVDADGGSEFFGEDAGHENDAGFGDGVGEKFTPAEQATNIGEIDDDALPGFGEMRSGGLGGEEGGFEIGVEGGVPGLLGGGAEFGFEEIGGVVDEDVEAVEVVDGLIDEILDFGDAGEVGGNGDGAAAEFFDFVDGVAGFVFGMAVVDGDVGAFGGEAQGDEAADAFGGTGDEGDAAREVGLGRHGEKVAQVRREGGIREREKNGIRVQGYKSVEVGVVR